MKLIWILVIFGTVAGRSDKFGNKDPTKSTGWSSMLPLRFTEANNLCLAPNNLNFIFIIIRRGMVVPESTTSKKYPNNWFYKSEWTQGMLTSDGKRLMLKLGKSLYMRYRKVIGHWTDDRIFISTSNNPATEECGKEVVKGLFGSVTPTPRYLPLVNMDATIDKSSLFSKQGSCPEYIKLREEAEKKWTSKSIWDPLYTKLTEITGGNQNQNSEWYINSPQKVYFLWELMDFERKSRHLGSSWYNDKKKRKDIQKVVQVYYKDIMETYWPMYIYLIGRLFQEMMNSYYKHKRQVHIHVTDDFSFAAFKAILLSNSPTPPEVGETLLVEVDMNLNTRVHTYRPYHSIFSEEHKFEDFKKTENFHELKDRIYKRLCLPMTENVWEDRCVKSEFILDLPPQSDNQEGCGPTWVAERKKQIEENKKIRVDLEHEQKLPRSFFGSELTTDALLSSRIENPTV